MNTPEKASSDSNMGVWLQSYYAAHPQLPVDFLTDRGDGQSQAREFKGAGPTGTASEHPLA